MRRIVCLAFLLFVALCEIYAQENTDTLFLIDKVINKKQVVVVLDSGSLEFYDVNDSFLFIVDKEGHYRLVTIASNSWEKGRIKPKKHLRLSGAKFSEFRGNTPHIGNFRTTEFSEFHIDESVNYYWGSYGANINGMKYLPEFNSVVLHQVVREQPRQERLRLVSCFPTKKLKVDYIGAKHLVETPEVLFDTEEISKLVVDEKSAKIAFLSSDTLLVQLDLKNTGIRNDYYDLGSDYDIGFYNEDSIVIIQKNGTVSILSLLTHQSSRVSGDLDLTDKSNFFVLGKKLYCTKNRTLYVVEIGPVSLRLKEEYVFGSDIISYKVSSDATKVMVQTR